MVGLTNYKIIKQLDKVLSYYQTGYQFTPSYRAGRWDGRFRLLYKNKNNIHTFLSGLLPYVEVILKNNKIAYEIVDERKEVKLGRKIKLRNLDKRDYQQKAIEAAVKNQGGMIKVATGGGKTAIMAGIVSEFNVSTMVYVPGIDLLYQTAAALNVCHEPGSVELRLRHAQNRKPVQLFRIRQCAVRQSFVRYAAADQQRSPAQRVFTGNADAELGRVDSR